MRNFILFLCISAVAVWSQLSFVGSPSLIRNSASSWIVDFEVSAATDVEVSVVSLRDSTIVRHLAAGVLGPNPPAPLAASVLHQTLAWDGKDDLGAAVTAPPESLKVRVRAGMSASLDKFAGGNPYRFTGDFCGLIQGANNEMYVWGAAQTLGSHNVRAYDKDGNYLRTIYPFPAGKTASQLNGYGVLGLVNGKYTPLYTYIDVPTLGSLLQGYRQNGALLPLKDAGTISAISGNSLSCLTFNIDGTTPATAPTSPLITSPTPPTSYGVMGTKPVYAALSPNPNFFYLSSYEEVVSNAGTFASGQDTGFWRGGRVFKVNRTTKTATVFVALDSIPMTTAERTATIGDPQYYTVFHGVFAMKTGHVLVCDRYNDRVSVYDSNGVFVTAIDSVPNPTQVWADDSSGAVFVLLSNAWNYHPDPFMLRKYSKWGAGRTLAYSTMLWNSTTGPGHVSLKGLYGSDGKLRLWIGESEKGVRIYRDDGTGVALVKDFQAGGNAYVTYDRIGLDRKTETLFFTNGVVDLFKITDWNNPAIVHCSTSTKAPLYAGDIAVSFDRQLYMRGIPGNNYITFSGPITRYTLDYYHAPIVFPNIGTNIMTPYIYGMSGAGYADKGLAVAPGKQVAVMAEHNFAEHFIDTIPPGGTTDSISQGGTFLPWTKVQINHGNYNNGQGGVKYDLKGNLYFGVTILPAGHIYPAGYSSDDRYKRVTGSVVRYAPGAAAGTVDFTNQTSSNSDYIYKHGCGLYSGNGYTITAANTCRCRSARFDVDLYGRLFLPNSVTDRVTVVDNNDNQITAFGEYGNWDSQGSGSLVPTGEIAFACPLAVAASDNFIYVNDLINTRIARVKMNYALDNMPWVAGLGAENQKGAAVSDLRLTCSPNPFNPQSRISVSLPQSGMLRLAVYDVGGRLVKTLASGKFECGSYTFQWDARDVKGQKVAPGMYVYRLTAGKELMMQKTLLAK